VLRAIAAQRIAVIERLRDPRSIALAKGDNSLVLGAAIAARLKDPALDDYHAVLERLDKRDRTGPSVVEEEEWREDLDAASKLIKQRDEHQAVEEAAPDLVRLERYYRRVWSEQRRAIQQFINIRPRGASQAPDARNDGKSYVRNAYGSESRTKPND
jgi:hypothetical protein